MNQSYTWIYVLALVALVFYSIVEGRKADNKQQEWVFQLNNRLKTVEEQRDIERRVTDIEKSLRTYCTGRKIDMCGQLEPTR